MLNSNIDDNFHRFLEEAISTGCVWGLEDNEQGWAQSASEKFPDTSVIPFWSQPEYAELHRKDEWKGYQVAPIALEDFLDDWLPGMHEDVILAGVNWNQALEGEDLEPLDLLQAIEQAMG